MENIFLAILLYKYMSSLSILRSDCNGCDWKIILFFFFFFGGGGEESRREASIFVYHY